jgi:hypothetical protein
MLSPHEFTALLVIRNAPDPLHLDLAEMDILLDRQLVAREHATDECRRPRVTARGELLLRAMGQIS